ncbi:MAG: NEW3 domain-containing protein [Thermodesulfobacteriota bacterium]
MNRSKRGQIFFIPLVLAMVVSLLGISSVLAQEEKEKKDDRPPRSIAMAPEYPGVIVPPGEDVSMDLIIYNKGKSDENVDVDITSIPKGWKAKVKTYKFTVTGAHVKNGDSTRLTFFAEPEKKTVKPGRYVFRVQARTQDGVFKSSQDITVTVSEKAEAEKKKSVIITTSYPVLRGPTDAKFEFSLEVDNKLDKDKVYNLTSQGPENWEINFKPAYEEKYISSLRIKANQSQTVAVEVKPYRLAEAGEYPINVRVGSGDAKAKADLNVILTGTYKLEAGTPTGLLSLEAQKGKPANMSIYVKNTGSAANHNIKFLSIKPENWKVKFEPEKIEALKPNELKQVEVTITPAQEALVGDYSVGLNIDGEKDSKNMEMRVTVKASTTWGWIGIGIIVLVILGLGGLFTWLGRR